MRRKRKGSISEDTVTHWVTYGVTYVTELDVLERDLT